MYTRYYLERKWGIFQIHFQVISYASNNFIFLDENVHFITN